MSLSFQLQNNSVKFLALHICKNCLYSAISVYHRLQLLPFLFILFKCLTILCWGKSCVVSWHSISSVVMKAKHPMFQICRVIFSQRCWQNACGAYSRLGKAPGSPGTPSSTSSNLREMQVQWFRGKVRWGQGIQRTGEKNGAAAWQPAHWWQSLPWVLYSF